MCVSDKDLENLLQACSYLWAFVFVRTSLLGAVLQKMFTGALPHIFQVSVHTKKLSFFFLLFWNITILKMPSCRNDMHLSICSLFLSPSRTLALEAWGQGFALYCLCPLRQYYFLESNRCSINSCWFMNHPASLGLCFFICTLWREVIYLKVMGFCRDS